MEDEELQLVGECVPVRRAREVTALEPGASDRVDHAVDHLLDTPLPLRRAKLAAEVLRGDHVRRRLGPELGNFDVLLFEDVAALAWDGRVAELPLDLVVGVDALAGEAAVDPERFRPGVLKGFLAD